MKITTEHLEHFSRAIEFYARRGFKNIEVPWFLSEEAVSATKPKDARLFNTPFGFLPASAEQSFIQMLIDQKLPPGRYQALTPCFRDNEPDKWHQNVFMKLELIDTTDKANFLDLLEISKYCFELISNTVATIANGSHENEYDLKINGIEVGSYGIRKIKNISYAYGTGLSEPRYSMALKHK